MAVPEDGPPTVFPSLLYTIPLPTPIFEGVTGGLISDRWSFASPVQDGAPGWRSPVTLLPVPNVGGGGMEVNGGRPRLGTPEAVPLNVLDRVDLFG